MDERQVTNVFLRVRDKAEAGAHEPPPDLGERLERRAQVLRRLMVNGAGPVAVLEKFYEFLDKSIPEAYPAPTCKRGCSYCCYVGVQISGPEAKYIEHKTGHKIRSLETGVCDLNERRPCPFLKDNECSIYEYRPSVCRAFLSFSPVSHCQERTPHLMLTIHEPGRGGFEWANVMAREVTVYLMSRNSELAAVNDIRAFFLEPANTEEANK